MSKLKRNKKKTKVNKKVQDANKCEECHKTNGKYARLLAHYSDIVHHILDNYGKDEKLRVILDDIMSDFTKVKRNPRYKDEK